MVSGVLSAGHTRDSMQLIVSDFIASNRSDGQSRRRNYSACEFAKDSTGDVSSSACAVEARSPHWGGQKLRICL